MVHFLNLQDLRGHGASSMALLVCWSTTLVKTEISQQVLDGFLNKIKYLPFGRYARCPEDES